MNDYIDRLIKKRVYQMLHGDFHFGVLNIPDVKVILQRPDSIILCDDMGHGELSGQKFNSIDVIVANEFKTGKTIYVTFDSDGRMIGYQFLRSQFTDIELVKVFLLEQHLKFLTCELTNDYFNWLNEQFENSDVRRVLRQVFTSALACKYYYDEDKAILYFSNQILIIGINPTDIKSRSLRSKIEAKVGVPVVEGFAHEVMEMTISSIASNLNNYLVKIDSPKPVYVGEKRDMIEYMMY